MSTLKQLIDQLPRVLSVRYSQEFWIRIANKVLLDLEQKGDIPRTKEFHFIPVDGNVYEIDIPDQAHKVLGVWINSRPLDYIQRGRRIELETPVMNIEPAVIYANVGPNQGSGGDESQKNKRRGWSNAYTGSPSIIISTSMEGMAIAFKGGVNQSSGNEGRSAIVRKWEVGNTELDRLFKVDILAGDEFTASFNYIVLEYTSAFYKNSNIETEQIFEDPAIEQVLCDGLRYYGELQSDEESEFSMKWSRQYDKSVNRWFAQNGRGIMKQQGRWQPSLGKLRENGNRGFSGSAPWEDRWNNMIAEGQKP